MERKLKKSNWHWVVRKALNKDRDNKRPLRSEWKEFSKSEVDILLLLEDDDVLINTLIDQLDFLKQIEIGSESFLVQCLVACISCQGQEDFETRFVILFNLIEDFISNRKITSTSRKSIRQSILIHLIEKEDTNNLSRLLKLLHSNHEPIAESKDDAGRMNEEGEDIFNNVYPQVNSEILIAACARNNHLIVQELVSFGYR